MIIIDVLFKCCSLEIAAKEGEIMFGLEITTAGKELLFLVDTEEALGEIINNFPRVTKVNVWSNKELRFLSNDEICDLVGV